MKFEAGWINNSLASALRSVLVALAVAVTLPMIDTYGILLTHTLCAVSVWISFVYVVILKRKRKEKSLLIITSDSGLGFIIKYGGQMRAWVDVGFSTAENN
jgi:hypothetical protein